MKATHFMVSKTHTLSHFGSNHGGMITQALPINLPKRIYLKPNHLGISLAPPFGPSLTPEMPEVWEDMESRGKVPPDYATQPVRGQYPPTAFLSEGQTLPSVMSSPFSPEFGSHFFPCSICHFLKKYYFLSLSPGSAVNLT